MKKFFAIWALAAGFFATGCGCKPDPGIEQPRPLVCTFDGEAWDALIDEPQYGGPLLYPVGADAATPAYSWHDPATGLSSRLTDCYGDKMFWGGGIAVTNHFSTDVEANASYMEQLTVFADAAHSGSNCAVINGYASAWSDCRACLEFASGEGIIESVYVCPTTYAYAMMKYGGPLMPALEADKWVKVIAEGYDLNDEPTGLAAELLLFAGGESQLDGWTEWNLSVLGTVHKVRFDFRWNGEGGAEAFMHPAYVAIDDIAVRQ